MPTATSALTATCRSALAQDLRTSGGDFCGAWSDQNFGKPHQHVVVRSEHPAGLVQPAERLDHRRDAPARTAAARVARSRLHAALAAALHGHRQPVPVCRRHDAVQRDGAARSAAARRRRLRGVRPLQRGAREGQPGRQLPHVFGGHRQRLPDVQRHRHQRLGAVAERPAAAGRHQHRAAGHGLLRGAGEAAGADRRVLDGQRSAGVQPDEPLLPLRAGHRHASARPPPRIRSRSSTCSSARRC